MVQLAGSAEYLEKILGKGIISAITFVCPLADEIIEKIVPNQTIERIKYLFEILE